MLINSIVAVAGLFGGLVLGADLLLMLIGAAAIVPALVFGRWEQLLLAFWLGAFVVMTPLYHPYTRLLLPGLPAAICLALWSLDAGWNLRGRSPDARLRLGQNACAARIATSAAVLAGLAIFAAAHPFGWIPSSALWRRWSSGESYRSFGLAIDRDTPADAVVLCQGLPPMPLYCPRRWLTLDRLPFTQLLPQAPVAAPCYLAVDDWGAHGEGHREALGTLIAQRSCLHRVAAVANDLNIVTLLDNLSPWDVAKKLRGASAAGTATPSAAGADFLPPALREMGEDVIVLYRIDRACVDSHSVE